MRVKRLEMFGFGYSARLLRDLVCSQILSHNFFAALQIIAYLDTNARLCFDNKTSGSFN